MDGLLNKGMNESDKKEEIIAELENICDSILDLFDKKEIKDTERFEESYYYMVGSLSKQLRKLLDTYHEGTKEEQTLLKPSILYYLELQQYFVYLVRYPSAIYQKNHPYLAELKEMIEKKGFLLKTKYKEKAIQESMLFEPDFREKLEKTLNRRRLGNGN